MKSEPTVRRMLEALASRIPSLDDDRPNGRFTVCAGVVDFDSTAEHLGVAIDVESSSNQSR
jgi:hypothetical protein